MFDRLFSQKEIDKGNLMNWDSQVIDSEIPLTLGRVSDRKPWTNRFYMIHDLIYREANNATYPLQLRNVVLKLNSKLNRARVK